MTKKIIVIGKIASVYGLKGWLKVVSFTEPPENIFNYKPWQLLIGNKKEEIVPTHFKIQGGRMIVQMPGYTDCDVARRFTGAEIAINREQLPPLPANEYYWTDLEGLAVISKTNEPLGIVDHVMATGTNDVLVVQGVNKRHLIPFLFDDVILEIDLSANTIRVDWDPDF